MRESANPDQCRTESRHICRTQISLLRNIGKLLLRKDNFFTIVSSSFFLTRNTRKKDKVAYSKCVLKETFIEKRSFTFWVTEVHVYKYVLHGAVGSSAAYTLSGSQPTLFLFEFLSGLVGLSFPEKSNLVNYNLTIVRKKRKTTN